ncbi:hypothetical protein ABZ478_38490 [Streptomyces sp. NPDC005706]|uniref:hypothetical protein n=1 Tax=Streptomyces sp. NPDC005706 TaxID=3157169 RepID=UPI003400B807
MTSAGGALVPRPGPKLEPLLLSGDEWAVCERWTRRASSAQALALRVRIVLACAGLEIPPMVAVARDLLVAAEWLDELLDEPRPGQPPAISVDQTEAVVATTLEKIPKERHSLVAGVDGGAQRLVEVHPSADSGGSSS